MREDFPAAHSMDTTWFAVDSKGRLGVFDSREGGATPEGVPREGCWERAFEHLPQDEDGAVPIPVDGSALAALCPPGTAAAHVIAHAGLPPEALGQRAERLDSLELAVITHDPRAVTDMLADAAPPFRLRPAVDGASVLLFERCDLALLWFLVQEEIVLGVSPPANHMPGSWRDEMWHEWPLPLLGFYVFECQTQSATPYEKLMSPAAPLMLSELSPPPTPVIDLTDVDFETTAAIQPAVLTPCRAWRPWWRSVDGADYDMPESLGGDIRGAALPKGDPERLRLGVLPEARARRIG